MSKTVLITGGTGMVGKVLQKALEKKGYTIRLLSRNPDPLSKVPMFKWDTKLKTLDNKAFEGVDYIVHLAGDNVADGMWTADRKKEIFDSRVKSTEMLYYYLKGINHSVKAIVSASAIGYYGDTGEELVDETRTAGYDFLANTSKQWEHAVRKFGELNIRSVNLRMGLVLAENEGALASLSTPVRWYLGMPLGTGNQYYSWVHIDDVCNAFILAIENKDMSGAYNVVAPQPITNREFLKVMAKVLNRSLWLPAIPKAILELFLGEKASIVINSNNVSAEKLKKAGFKFSYPVLEPALKSLLIKGGA